MPRVNKKEMVSKGKMMKKINIENKRIQEYSKEFPIELKFLIQNLPKDDIDWSLLMYLFRYTSKGNIITSEKICKFFGINKKVVEKRLNKMNWLIRQYVNFGPYEYSKPFFTYEITEIGAVALIKFIEIFKIGEYQRLDRKDVIDSLALQDKIYENLKDTLEKYYRDLFVGITYDGKIIASSGDNLGLLEKLKELNYPGSQIFIRKVGADAVAGWF